MMTNHFHLAIRTPRGNLAKPKRQRKLLSELNTPITEYHLFDLLLILRSLGFAHLRPLFFKLCPIAITVQAKGRVIKEHKLFA
jgi:hypothetical protein